MRIDKLRAAIRKNQVSFPSQIPIFPKHTRPDLQRKLVQLYFVLGWNRSRIRARYGLGRNRLQQILAVWKERAVELGYIQTIPSADNVMAFSTRAPIQVVLSPVIGDASVPVNLIPVPARPGLDRPTDNDVPNGREPQSGCRPRSKRDVRITAEVLRQLQAGRTVAEIAYEIGISRTTILVWKRQYELLLLRRENADLRRQLADLAVIEKTDSFHRNYHS
jgi:transposase